MEDDLLSGRLQLKPIERDRKFMARMYLLIAAPVLVLLCFLTQPLHSLDEPAHFLRVVQLSGGSVFPVLGADHKSTGSYEEAGTRKFAGFYGTRYENYRQWQNKVTHSELSALFAITNGRNDKEFIQHSNTTIYFPIVYAAPVAAVYVARMLTDKPLIWLYAGRLANALVGAALTYLVLRHATRGQFLFFAAALLPITLFQMAALSADSLLVPAAMALAMIFGRVIEGRPLSVPEWVAAVLAGAFVGLGKFAYLPLVVILPLVAVLIRRRFDRSVIALGLATTAIVIVWVVWSARIHNLVFTMRQDDLASKINVQAQLALILAHPLVFAKALHAALGLAKLKTYFFSLSGGVIGWFDVWLPSPITLLNFLVLAATFLVDYRARATSILVRSGIYFACLSSSLAVFLLLYLQWNAVGSNDIDGVQGRYFLPLLPFACVATPSLVLTQDKLRLFSFALVGWGCFSAAVTVFYVAHRYWL